MTTDASMSSRRDALRRFVRFNLVGAAGVAIQLATLVALERGAGVDYLVATALAVETSLLGNFALHRRVTWAERRRVPAGRSLARFHVSNGVVSLVGNVALMRVLVGGAGLTTLPANAVAVAACGLVNFVLADRYAFREDPSDFSQQSTCRTQTAEV